MARSTWMIPVLLLAGLSAAGPGAASRPPVFAYDDDSFRTTLSLIGGRLPQGPDSLAFAEGQAACGQATDSSSAGPGAWYGVDLIDKRAGKELRFPVDAAALRNGLRKACDAQGEAAPARIAAALKALAATLKVRMLDPESGAGE